VVLAAFCMSEKILIWMLLGHNVIVSYAFKELKTRNDKTSYLKGQCHEIFVSGFFI
jgi:hypothetical protein